MTIPDSATLSAVITALGGTPVEARTLQFECVLGSVRSLVPKLNSLGVAVRKLEGHDRITATPAGPQTTIRCEVLQAARRRKRAAQPLGFNAMVARMDAYAWSWLYDVRFWQIVQRQICPMRPSDEDDVLLDLSKRLHVSVARLKRHYRAYRRGLMVHQHPGSTAIN
jgi:hypothetical protein